MNKGNIKAVLLLIVMAFVSVTVFAVPAKRTVKTLTLADGTKVQATLVGDEHGHWYQTLSGKALTVNEANVASYLTDDQFTALQESRLARMTKTNVARMAKSPRKTDFSGDQPKNFIGNKRGIVILVNFADKAFNAKHTRQTFINQFNEVGYSENNHVGSVHDYFYDQSYGKFNLVFDVVGPVTVSQTMSYYGANDSAGNDKHPGSMVAEAVQLVDSIVDFRHYDWDGDGEVDQVFVIYAGYGEHAGASSYTIWPHEWSLTESKENGDGSGPITVDGVKVDTYACSCELANSYGTTLNGVGTACHEFSHCLGFPDMYNTSNSGAVGMENWDLLDYGSYNGPGGDGEVPPGYTSYERYIAGWLTPTVIDRPCMIDSMPALECSPVAYKVVNSGKTDEYLLLDNRQPVKWDSYITTTKGECHGMLINHIDYDETAWIENTVNNVKGHSRITYFPADNSFTATTYPSDPFPGTKNVTSFTDNTTPAAKWYNKNADGSLLIGRPIEDIAENNQLISFKFNGGLDLFAPTELSTIGITSNSFTANWNSVENAESYKLMAVPTQASKSVESSLLVSEDMSTLKDKGASTSLDLGKSLDSYFQTSGWYGNKVYYNSKNGIKLGSGSALGYVHTPALNATDGTLTVRLNAAYYGTDASSIYVSILSPDSVEVSSSTFSLTSSFIDYYTQLEGATIGCKVNISTLASKKRVLLNNIEVYDGAFVADDFANSSSSKAFANKTGSVVTQTMSGDTIYVSDVKNTCYTFRNLTHEAYKWYVKAVNSLGETAWSKVTKVVLDSSLEGDVNGDGSVDISDVNAIISAICGSSLSPEGESAGEKGSSDVNGDGTTDISDVNFVIAIICAN